MHLLMYIADIFELNKLDPPGLVLLAPVKRARRVYTNGKK